MYVCMYLCMYVCMYVCIYGSQCLITHCLRGRHSLETDSTGLQSDKSVCFIIFVWIQQLQLQFFFQTNINTLSYLNVSIPGISVPFAERNRLKKSDILADSEDLSSGEISIKFDIWYD